ncbi:FACR055Wp [Eremothecium gossypii FDAG1]|nr:FACR055Wp [Eremothecium gossypii FDAG1]
MAWPRRAAEVARSTMASRLDKLPEAVSRLQSLSHRQLLRLAQGVCIPALSPSLHKGQSGRVCVVGGSLEYTGAPYFSAHAAALMGSDLVHVLCEWNAATPIKAYSPDLMVHPHLRDSSSLARGLEPATEAVRALVDRVHVLVLGPGLGRDPAMLRSVAGILEYVADKHEGGIPVVLDADALLLLSEQATAAAARAALRRFPPDRVILTPNAVEAKRLAGAFELDDPARLAEHLNCTVVLKGGPDRIYAPGGGSPLSCSHEGSLKRVGGQGDTLTGCLAAMLAYNRAIHDFGIAEPDYTGLEGGTLSASERTALCCYVACAVARGASHRAYEAQGRAMQTSDLNGHVGAIFRDFFPERQ